MLRGSEKKEALTSLDRARQCYESQVEATQTEVNNLYLLRQKCSKTLMAHIKICVNDLTNMPKEFYKSWSEFKQAISIFDNTVEKLKAEYRNIHIEDASMAAAGVTTGLGVATGAGMAAFGSTATMAVATTFGTASSGAAISTLSGAAATNAALAWLGGGTLAAGGGGVAAGNALLALAGPIGIGIATLGLASGAIVARKKNGKVIEEAQVEGLHMQELTRKLSILECDVIGITSLISKHYHGAENIIGTLEKTAPTDFKSFNAVQKEMFNTLIAHIHELSKLINKKIH
ncbi:hypothetical protein [Serratia fonticola]|uniref:hypothetical protein n=1 Tax=Serratia fonticola TaxID=47917 RepID=UPI0034C60D24